MANVPKILEIAYHSYLSDKAVIEKFIVLTRGKTISLIETLEKFGFRIFIEKYLLHFLLFEVFPNFYFVKIFYIL